MANADPEQLVPILMQAQSNKIRLNTQDDRQVKEKLLIKARAITESANRLWRKFIITFASYQDSRTVTDAVLDGAEREMQEELMEEEQ